MRATELRYQQRRILEALDIDNTDNTHNTDATAIGTASQRIRRIDIFVRPDASPVPPSGRSRRPLGISGSAARQLAQAADAETDPELRRALERLASRRR
mgnify:CR=1 FL=1